MTLPLRQKLIEKLIETKYATDSDQYHDSNIAFLQSLSVEELQAMVDIEDDYEEDFDDEELQYECPVCNSTDTCNDPDYPETMMNCNNCGSEWNTDGDVTLNSREL